MFLLMTHPAEVTDDGAWSHARILYAVPWDLNESSWHSERQGWVHGDLFAPMPEPGNQSMETDYRT